MKAVKVTYHFHFQSSSPQIVSCVSFPNGLVVGYQIKYFVPVPSKSVEI